MRADSQLVQRQTQAPREHLSGGDRLGVFAREVRQEQVPAVFRKRGEARLEGVRQPS